MELQIPPIGIKRIKIVTITVLPDRTRLLKEIKFCFINVDLLQRTVDVIFLKLAKKPLAEDRC